MIFIDASAFIAHDNKDDVHHAAAAKLWQELESGKHGQLFTSDYVFNEVVGVTFRKLGRGRAIVLGQQILKSVFVINIDEHILAEAWKIFSKTELNFGLVDCTTLVVMELASSKAIATFDKEFGKVVGLDILD